MTDKPSQDIIAVARASAGRRILGMAALLLMGAMLIYVAFTGSPDFGWRIFLIVIGGGALWMAEHMRRSTSGEIQLTETELRDSDGTVIARIEDIDGIDRGVFAFKPSNGFLLHTRTPAVRTWRLGLWWRFGRRIGIGGMTPGHQTKAMSEIIGVMMAKRDMDAS